MDQRTTRGVPHKIPPCAACEQVAGCVSTSDAEFVRIVCRSCGFGFTIPRRFAHKFEVYKVARESDR